MTTELLEEFNQYLESISIRPDLFELPEYLSDFKIVSCLQDNPQKKTLLLKNAEGRKLLCKYACGEFQTMLRAENDISLTETFSFLPCVLAYRETEGGAFLLREYVEGQSLQETVDENGPLPLNEALSVIRSISDSLARLHNLTPPIIHRDIKPSNIVRTKSGDCYLVDMGTLRRYQEGSTSDTLCMGTADFAAPEQFGARQTDARTDIYGLGMLFYFLLTGKSRLQDSSFTGVPHRYRMFIKKCTSFNPDDRYDNIRQVQTALAHLAPQREFVRSRLAACVSWALSLALLAALIIPKLNTDDHPVEFSSDLLEQAVRAELSRSDGETITYRDLKNVSRLTICGTSVLHEGAAHTTFSDPHSVNGVPVEHGNITDLSLLAHMPNLRYLVLDHQEVSDLTPLKNLPLGSVSLFGNPVIDLSPLAGNRDLYDLNISNTKVHSLEALANCTELQNLNCISTPVSSLAPLANAKNLVSLYVRDTAVTDYTPLESLPINTLECSNISASGLESLKKIKSLQTLAVYHSGTPSVKTFDGLENLTSLSIDYNTLNNLDGIEKFNKLNFLSLTNNPITECPPLPTLRILNVSSTGVRDFSFLNDMPALTELYISETQRPYVYEAVPEPWFDVSATPW